MNKKTIYPILFLFLFFTGITFSQEFYRIDDAIKKNLNYGITLDLSNENSDTISDEIFKVKNLYSLLLKSKNGSKLPIELSKLNGIGSLTLKDFIITEKEIDYLYHFSNLSTLTLENITFEVPLNWLHRTLNYIPNIIIKGNTQNIITKDFFELKQLSFLSINDAEVEYLLANIRKFQNLNYLMFDNNNITSLGSSLGGLDKLKRLEIRNNPLTVIPFELCYMETLEYLNISNSKIAEIPIYVADMKNLKTLILKNNLIESIAYNGVFCELKNLSDLDLSNNKLTRLDVDFLKCVHFDFNFNGNKISKLEKTKINEFLYKDIYDTPSIQNLNVQSSEENYFVDGDREEPKYERKPGSYDYKFNELPYSDQSDSIPYTFRKYYEEISRNKTSAYFIFKTIRGYEPIMYGISDQNHNMILPPIFHEYKTIENTSNIILKCSDKEGLFDVERRKWILPLSCSEISLNESNIYIYKQNDLFGLMVDSTDILLPKYSYISLFDKLSDGRKIYSYKIDDKRGLFDLKNNKFLPFYYESINSGKHYTIEQNKSFNLYDIEHNQFLFKKWYKEILYQRDSFIVNDNGDLFLIDSLERKLLDKPIHLIDKTLGLFATSEGNILRITQDKLISLGNYVFKSFNSKSRTKDIVVTKNSKFGLLSMNDIYTYFEAFDFEYDSIIQVNDSHYILKKDGKYGVLKVNGKDQILLFDIKYDLIDVIFSEDYGKIIFKIKDGIKYNVINQNGKQLYDTAIADSVSTLSSNNISNFFKVKIDDYWYLVDFNFNIKKDKFENILGMYDYDILVNNGNLYHLRNNELEKNQLEFNNKNDQLQKFLINKQLESKKNQSGNNNSDLEFETTFLVKGNNSLGIVKKQGKYGLYSRDFYSNSIQNFLSPTIYDTIIVNNSYLTVKLNNKYGLLYNNWFKTGRDSIILEIKYDTIKFKIQDYKSYVIACKGKKSLFYDLSNSKREDEIKKSLDFITNLSKDKSKNLFLKSIDNGKFFLTNQKGELLTSAIFDDIIEIKDERLLVKTNNQFSIYNYEENKFITDLKYDELLQISSDYYFGIGLNQIDFFKINKNTIEYQFKFEIPKN